LYYPFLKYPKLYNLIWSFHFYFIGLGLFLLAFYSLLRYFYSRRLSILGVFSVVSTWSFSKILGVDYFAAMTTTGSVLWIWSIMWSTRSGTYRSGLFTGLVGTYLVLIYSLNILLIPVGLFYCYRLFLKERTVWYRRQWLKYNAFGVVISLAVLLSDIPYLSYEIGHYSLLKYNVIDFIYRKAFFTIAPIGLLLMALYFFNKSRLVLTFVNFDQDKVKEVIYGVVAVVLLGVAFLPNMISGFSIIWMLSFFSLIPIEWIFQSISRLRSKRNLIYAMYILICLLDSQLENRFRIIGKMFLEIESFKYFIQL